MQVHVKTPHIKIDIEGTIPPQILSVLKDVYGRKISISDNDNTDDSIDISATPWHKKMTAAVTPGKAMANYRKLMNLTQTALGQKLGGISKQNISQMERDVRPISKKIAKKLADLYKVSVENFI